jgi:hypothetical protein
VTKKYPMMVTLKEAGKIYRARAMKERKKQGFLPIQKPTGEPEHVSAKKIRKAVTLTILEKENIK